MRSQKQGHEAKDYYDIVSEDDTRVNIQRVYPCKSNNTRSAHIQWLCGIIVTAVGSKPLIVLYTGGYTVLGILGIRGVNVSTKRRR